MLYLTRTFERRRLFVSSFVAMMFVLCGPIYTFGQQAALTATSGATSNQPQAYWQTRRAEFTKIVKDMRSGDPSAPKRLDDVLTEFDTKPLVRTPLENMEIVGVYYLPREGIEKCMSVIAMNAALGWYDVLRFASESGREEISNNESFFKRAFLVAGPQFGPAAIKYASDHPDAMARLVEQGLAMAGQRRDAPYDHLWPQSYGLERAICAQGGACTPMAVLPREQWDSAWQQTRTRVKQYFAIGAAPVPSSASSK
jgi:hypothetical protein